MERGKVGGGGKTDWSGNLVMNGIGTRFCFMLPMDPFVLANDFIR